MTITVTRRNPMTASAVLEKSSVNTMSSTLSIAPLSLDGNPAVLDRAQTQFTALVTLLDG